MDEMIYNALSQYFTALCKMGYYKYSDVKKLLVLIFYRDFVFNDYRGIISRSDYHLIERALNCLFGTSCLIPYPDYLKAGKLHLGTISDLARRIKGLENGDISEPTDTSISILSFTVSPTTIYNNKQTTLTFVGKTDKEC